jgi:hypothetical protein
MKATFYEAHKRDKESDLDASYDFENEDPNTGKKPFNKNKEVS